MLFNLLNYIIIDIYILYIIYIYDIYIYIIIIIIIIRFGFNNQVIMEVELIETITLIVLTIHKKFNYY